MLYPEVENEGRTFIDVERESCIGQEECEQGSHSKAVQLIISIC